MVVGNSGSLRGRPRDADADRRILDAALRLLGRDGFARMSVDAVAAEAGVAKPTIYRRYPGKAELAAAALAHLAADRDASAPVPTGDLAGDLVAVLRHFQTGIERPFGMALVGTVVAESDETPGLIALYREVIVQPRRRMVRGVFDAAVASGGVPAATDIDGAVDCLIGSYYAAYLENGLVAADWPERVTAIVLRGVLPRRD